MDDLTLEPALPGQVRVAAGETNDVLHAAFARRAAERPAATALAWSTGSMSYAELNRRSDAWAEDLQVAGVVAGDLVPVLLPRGPELVIAALATLKCGAAYALIDASWPPARIAAIVERLEARCVIRAAGAVPEVTTPSWDPAAAPHAASPGFRSVLVSERGPACVFFTSGTTGTPKVVVAPHGAITRLFSGASFAHFGPGCAMPLAAPGSWDAFALELWSMLLTGGTAVIVEDRYLSAATLRQLVVRHGVNLAWLTCSLFNMIVEEDLGAFQSLKQVLIGGERVSGAHALRFLSAYPDATLINGYGPVESAIFATTHRIAPADCGSAAGGVPVGLPAPRTRVFVLAGNRICGPGEQGEICIAGEGLAIGYHRDAAATAARFPIVDLPDGPARIYRTGDLGWWDSGGRLRCEGRLDRQLKVRGHRIEPEEVERQVEQCLPQVRSCRVVGRRGRDGAVSELLAFCIVEDGGQVGLDDLARLAPHLPPYQRPCQLVEVVDFPLTSQGKLDERALLTRARTAPEDTRVAHARPPEPTACLEREVAAVFAEVLGRSDVGTDDDLFALGGDSLAAGRVVARLGARFGRTVALAWIFDHPTPRGMALQLAAVDPDRLASAGVATLTSMQRSFLMRQLLDPTDQTSHCIMAWTLDGPLDRNAFDRALSETARRQQALGLAYRLDPLPTASPSGRPPPKLQILPREKTKEAALGEVRHAAAAAFDPQAGNVWRCILAPWGEADQAVLAVVVHHVAFDGASEAILARELSEGYAAALGARRRSPPPAPASRVYAAQSRALAEGDAGASRRRLTAELSGAPPLEWPPEPMPSCGAGGLQVDLPLERLARLDARAAAQGASRFVLLLHTFAAALREVCGQSDFVLGFPCSRRAAVETADAIGCHIDMLSVRFTSDSWVAGGLARTAERVRLALATPHVSYVELAGAAGAAQPGRPPLFQALFALQDQAAPRLSLHGVSATFIRLPYLALPLELHAEVWPEEQGGLRLELAWGAARPLPSLAERLAAAWVGALASMAEGP